MGERAGKDRIGRSGRNDALKGLKVGRFESWAAWRPKCLARSVFGQQADRRWRDMTLRDSKELPSSTQSINLFGVLSRATYE